MNVFAGFCHIESLIHLPFKVDFCHFEGKLLQASRSLHGASVMTVKACHQIEKVDSVRGRSQLSTFSQ